MNLSLPKTLFFVVGLSLFLSGVIIFIFARFFQIVITETKTIETICEYKKCWRYADDPDNISRCEKVCNIKPK